ncbi:MAG: PD-(D/E)XK nuclease family protein [Proteobacteria bacterium]|nr:PD-(D/E)XK nuclease family protein [Pseudomonadota bacterium]
MNIEHISVSRSDCFHQCPFSYKCRYHLKLPSPVSEPFYFVYGKVVHRIAEIYVQRKGETPLNEVTKEILSGQTPIEERFGKKSYCPPIPPEYKDRMPGHLRSIEKITKILGTTGETEFAFTYDLDPPNNKLITGVIDRLIEKDNKFWIVDYKTTKKGMWRKTPQTITKDIQLRCYARVVQKKFNVPAENIQAALYYLEGGDLIGARFGQQSLLDVEQHLLKTHQQIEAMPPDEARGKVGEHCRRCDWKNMCPFYANGKQWR